MNNTLTFTSLVRQALVYKVTRAYEEKQFEKDNVNQHKVFLDYIKLINEKSDAEILNWYLGEAEVSEDVLITMINQCSSDEELPF